MENILGNVLSDSAGYNSELRQKSIGLTKKWQKTGLLEGITNEYDIAHTSILLENQARQLIREATATGNAASAEQWSGVALPLVRRIFSEIAAKEFVSVQPMNLPSGLVFYLDFKYGTAQPGFTTGSGLTSQSDSVYGVTGAAAVGVDASQGLYGAGRFGYTINETGSNPLTYNASLTAGNYTSGSATFGSLNYDTAFSASIAGLFGTATSTVRTFTILTADLVRPDLEGIRAYVPRGAGIEGVYPAFTTINAAKTQITFVVSASAAGGSLTVDYHHQPTDVVRGDFEARTAADVGIPELNLELRSEPIVAKTRKLKAIWTPEMAQDLNAYHSIDAEAELTSMLSEYISMEIDLEILDMLIQNAQTTDYWSANIGEQWTGSGFTPNVAAGAAQYNQQDWFQTLGTKIQKVSNKIHQKTMRGGANFVVCSPDVATIIESIPGYSSDPGQDVSNFAMGVTKAGTMANRWTVYKNPYMKENTILLGYRGSQFLETGAVYAPYVPLMMTPLVYDPLNFTPRRGVMTRYAKKVVRPEFYGKILVTGLTAV